MKHDYLTAKGFTLIELLISMAIISIVMAGIVLSVSIQQKVHAARSVSTELEAGMRSCIDLISLEIMMAGFDVKKTSGAGITDASADSISFTSDLNKNGIIDEPNETIRFFVSNNTLVKGTAKSNLSVANNMTALSFRYFERNKSEPMMQPNNYKKGIRKIEITLTGRIPDEYVYGGGIIKTLTAEVSPRNLAEF